MNILFVTHSSGGSGSAKALVNLAKGMISLGHHVFVLSKNQRGTLAEQIESLGGKMFYGPVSLTIYPREGRFIGRLKRFVINYFGWRKSRKQIENIIEKYNIDIVHTNAGPLNLALNACRKKGIPHIWHMREYQDLDFGMSFFPCKKVFKKIIHQEGNYNIAITEGVFDYWELNRKSDTVIYDGVFSLEGYKETPQVKKEKYFLFVGRVEEAKGPHLIIDVLDKLLEKYPDYSLKIVGSYSPRADYYKKLKYLIERRRLEGKVEIMGVRNDVNELMQKATALIVPSRFEGFGFITVEAMLNNCLVIGKNTAGTKEQLDRGLQITGKEIGLRFNDEDELYRCMISAIEDETKEICSRALEVVVNNYSLERCVKETEQFYFQSYSDFKLRKNI